MRTVFITKYALTKGIITLRANINSEGKALLPVNILPDWMQHYTKASYLWIDSKDYCLNLADAKAVAEEKRRHAVKCAKRRVNVLESLRF